MQLNSTSTQVQSNLSQSIKNNNGTKETVAKINPVDETLHQPKPRPDEMVDKIKNGVGNFNKIFKPTHLEFQMHEASGKYFVNIIDDTTETVVKQIPSEEFLEMVARAKEQSGIIIDERI